VTESVGDQLGGDDRGVVDLFRRGAVLKSAVDEVAGDTLRLGTAQQAQAVVLHEPPTQVVGRHSFDFNV
jgi:hypothetical protein